MTGQIWRVVTPLQVVRVGFAVDAQAAIAEVLAKDSYALADLIHRYAAPGSAEAQRLHRRFAGDLVAAQQRAQNFGGDRTIHEAPWPGDTHRSLREIGQRIAVEGRRIPKEGKAGFVPTARVPLLQLHTASGPIWIRREYCQPAVPDLTTPGEWDVP